MLADVKTEAGHCRTQLTIRPSETCCG